MPVTIRPVNVTDTAVCGRILYAAFSDIAARHNFPPDFAAMDVATQVAGMLIRHPSYYGVVAELDGRVIGSNFLGQRDAVAAVGPISVEPTVQARGVGRALMQAVVERGRGAPSIRLVQDSFNRTSLSLYASLGFHVREPLAVMVGMPRSALPAGVEVRQMAAADVEACAVLCLRVLGYDRSNEVREMLTLESPTVAVRSGRIVAYATTLHRWDAAHAVAATAEDLEALMIGAAAVGRDPLAFLLPTRQAEVFAWCLREGLRMTKPMTLMTLGAYQEPAGCFVPSVSY